MIVVGDPSSQFSATQQIALNVMHGFAVMTVSVKPQRENLSQAL